jgi:hypothetical protein
MENRVWKFWCGLELPLSYSPWIIYELVSKYQFQLMSCYYLSKTVPWTLEYIKWSQPSQSRFLQVLFMISPLAPNNRHLGGMLASLRIYSIPLTHSMAPLASHPAHPHDWSFGKSFLTCPSHPFLFLLIVTTTVGYSLDYLFSHLILSYEDRGLVSYSPPFTHKICKDRIVYKSCSHLSYTQKS